MLLMNGARALSDFIKCFTCSRFSHAGIVVRLPDGLWVTINYHHHHSTIGIDIDR
jgi:hypothetical protein